MEILNLIRPNSAAVGVFLNGILRGFRRRFWRPLRNGCYMISVPSGIQMIAPSRGRSLNPSSLPRAKSFSRIRIRCSMSYGILGVFLSGAEGVFPGLSLFVVVILFSSIIDISLKVVHIFPNFDVPSITSWYLDPKEKNTLQPTCCAKAWKESCSPIHSDYMKLRE